MWCGRNRRSQHSRRDGSARSRNKSLKAELDKSPLALVPRMRPIPRPDQWQQVSWGCHFADGSPTLLRRELIIDLTLTLGP